MRIPFFINWIWSCPCINITWLQTVLPIPSSGQQRFKDTPLEAPKTVVRSRAHSCARKYPWRLTEVTLSHSFQDHWKIAKKCQFQP